MEKFMNVKCECGHSNQININIKAIFVGSKIKLQCSHCKKDCNIFIEELNLNINNIAFTIGPIKSKSKSNL